MGDRLSATGIADSMLEAEVLLRYCLAMDRAEFFASLNEDLPSVRERQFVQLVDRRLKGEPLAYITGHREFYGLDFVVNSDVLIPRQETELLVDAVVGYFPIEKLPERPRIADVGTGSGAIAIAIASYLPQATVYATDVSPEDPELEVVELPQRAQIIARYPAAMVRGIRNPDGAKAFLEFLQGPETGAILRRAGFGPP